MTSRTPSRLRPRAAVAPGVPQKQAVLFTAFDDFFDFPQHWIDDYVVETQRLFELFSPRKRATSSTALAPCVVWRTQNIASRHSNSTEARHHPSALNGIHSWLNRISSALARQAGIKVLDLTNTTLDERPLDYNADDARPPASIDRRRVALEGDVYHGYRAGVMAPKMLEELAELCCG